MRTFAVAASWMMVCSSLAMAGKEVWEYRVQPGDNLWSIARTHLSSVGHVPALQQLNRVSDPYLLPPNSIIRIPLQWMKQREGRIAIPHLSGRVLLQRQGQAPRDLQPEDTLQTGDVVETTANGSLGLRFEDGSESELMPGSRLQVRRNLLYPSTGAGNSRLHLDSGSIDNSISKNPLMPNRHSIQTPSAVSAVRGTVFSVDADGGEQSSTEVMEGEVQVEAAGRSVRVSGGYGTAVVRGQKPGQAQTLPPAPQLPEQAAPLAYADGYLPWPALDGVAAYRVVLERLGPQGQVWQRQQAEPALVQHFDRNGRYRLRVRGTLASGVSGYGASREFSVRAYPPPPLSVQPADGLRSFTRTLTLALSGSADSRYRVELSPQADFAGDVIGLELNGERGDVTLPRGGAWFWRAARLDEDGKPGPFGDASPLHASAGWSALLGRAPRQLVGRRYPVPEARYQLQLTAYPQPAGAPYTVESAEPRWPLPASLPSGRYQATISVRGSHGYLAREQHDLTLGD